MHHTGGVYSTGGLPLPGPIATKGTSVFIGHFAVSLAAKKPAPSVSLGTFFIASQFIDLLWPFFLLFGIESARIAPGITAFTPLDFANYPYTHSLLGVLIWSVLYGGIHYAWKRNPRAALVLGAAVFSHWVLDFATHRPDLPLAPGSETYFGLGLWNSVAATIIVEGFLFAAGVVLYTRTTAAKDKTGSYAFWGLVAFLVVTYLANAFGPPPPDEKTLAYAGLLQLVFIPWMYWIDRHRTVAPARHMTV